VALHEREARPLETSKLFRLASLSESIENFQLALKQQVEAGEKEETAMETTLNDALRKLQLALRDLQGIIHYSFSL